MGPVSSGQMVAREALQEARLRLLTIASKHQVEWRAERDQAIRAARASGCSLRQIMAAAEMSLGGVQRILASTGSEDPTPPGE